MLTDANSKLMSEIPHAPDLTEGSTSVDSEVLAFPASAAQEAFFYLEKLFPSHPAFNVPVRFKLDGALDLSLLRNAFNSLAARHEGLRTRFEEDDGKLLQIIASTTTFPIPLTDISHLSGSELDAEIDRLGSIEARTHFDLGKDPLFRASILSVGNDRHILQITIHHSVADGWSIGIMTDELAEFYNAALQAREPDLEPLAIQYADYTLWQREFLDGPEIKPHLEFWKDRLRNYVELELPTDRPRPAMKSWDGDIVSRVLPARMIERVARISREEGATMFHVFLAAFKAVASRYTGLEDIAVGTPVAGRTREELEPIIGTFINSVILRTDLSGDPSFRQLVGRVRDTTTDAIAHQDLPFEQLVKALQPRREGGRNPLFQINFTHQRDFVKPVSFGGARLTAFPSRSPGAIFDLHFFMVERADGWRASCDFACDLFDRETALRLLEHFETLLEAASSSPDQPLSHLPILPPAEMFQLDGWSMSQQGKSAERTIGDLFLERARLEPGRTALSYGEAISISNLLSESGVKPGDRVVLCAPSVPEMIAAQIAIMLRGAACVPLDPEYPAERIRFMLDDSGARVLLCSPALVDRLPLEGLTLIPLSPVPTGSIGEIPANLVAPEDASGVSHVFYTSGSTGTPKGVLVNHRGITRLVHGGFMDFSKEDSFLQSAPISFDAATLEIWMPLLHGGRVVLTGPEGTSLSAIAKAVRSQGVTCLWLTAGLFQTMVDEHLDDLKGLRYLLAGGDVLSSPHVRKAFEALETTKLINGYGPTENTTFTCCHTISRADLDRPSIPIGRPIGSTTVALLDEKLRPVPIGIPGELFTGGEGLALGYLNRPELTAERFVTHPTMGRAYRTGDLCRWLPDGSIEFIGRRDDQVKVRGFRIELGEIEAALSRHPGVRQSKALVRGETAETKRILAWVVPAGNQDVSVEDLNVHLSGILTPYMRPAVITLVESLPLSP
ncbi:MAG: non-ribosomal peptide synthetase, partial [Burkholderiales bacterium PBB4]